MYINNKRKELPKDSSFLKYSFFWRKNFNEQNLLTKLHI